MADAIDRHRPAAFLSCVVGATLLLGSAGCSGPTPSAAPPAQSVTAAAPSFVNTVWKVAESTGMSAGQLVVFLSDGTLVFASENSRPAFGTWRREGDGLVMVEEGLAYKTDIVALTATELRLRSHNPGGVVETRFVVARA